MVFFPVRVRHAQHIHAGGDVAHVHRCGRACCGRDESRPYDTPLQIVQRHIRDARAAAQFDEQNVIGGVGIDGQCRIIVGVHGGVFRTGTHGVAIP